jgi:hypothetical protein
MDKNTVEEYKMKIKAKYSEAKTGSFSGFLLKPSSAELKTLCLLLFDKGLSKLDQEIFNRFFDIKEETNKRKQIEFFSVDKLKPIANFLKGSTENTRIVNLDLIAVLVDFKSRPYGKFIAEENSVKLTADYSINESSKKGNSKLKRVDDKVGDFTINSSLIFTKKGLILIGLLFVLGFGFYGIRSFLFPNKDAMIWVKNHYEAVNYDKTGSAEVIPLNQYVLDNFKKITVSENTTFFKNGDYDTPMVWYGKSSNKKEHEYFNQPGLHPETGKTLKPISRYIIKKYILSK